MNRNRYDAMFERCREAGKGVFGAFLMLGDPDAKASADYLDALVEGGADMVELGIPFSDPVADGPVIQAAAARALAAGIRMRDCFELIAEFRARHPQIPVGILTYANIVEAPGAEIFYHELAAAGVDSLLIADVPALEAEPYSRAARKAVLDYVMIAATNTPGDNIDRIADLASGYTYCVARPGVTGIDEKLSLDHGALLAALKKAGAPPPVLGFGISTPAQVSEALGTGAAGVISGSAIVKLIADRRSPGEVVEFCRSLKAATRLQQRP
jgi:tryptophan synthase alpha chain